MLGRPDRATVIAAVIAAVSGFVGAGLGAAATTMSTEYAAQQTRELATDEFAKAQRLKVYSDFIFATSREANDWADFDSHEKSLEVSDLTLKVELIGSSKAFDIAREFRSVTVCGIDPIYFEGNEEYRNQCYDKMERRDAVRDKFIEQARIELGLDD